VPYGQNLCAPVSPKCGECDLTDFCKRVGVGTHR
jgi:endonuclease III